MNRHRHRADVAGGVDHMAARRVFLGDFQEPFAETIVKFRAHAFITVFAFTAHICALKPCLNRQIEDQR